MNADERRAFFESVKIDFPLAHSKLIFGIWH